MALSRFVLQPGIEREASQSAAIGRWWNANRVRFQGGWPEKLGGWLRRGSTLLEGRVRALVAWALLEGDVVLAAGSNVRLYLEKAAIIYDITPVDRTRAMTSGIDTLAGSTVVTFTTDTPHGASPGDILTLDAISGTSRTPSGITVGGITFSGDYYVQTVPSNVTLTISAGPASSTVAGGGGAATVTFFLPSGRPDDTQATGFGIGGYSLGTYSTPRPAGGLPALARFWWLDAWGEILLGVPSEGALYSWWPGPGGVVDERAERVVNAVPADGPPLINGGMIVLMPQRQVLLLGCSDLDSTTAFDPMLLRWSDIEDFTAFRATALNAAGSIRLQGGTEIRSAFNTQLQTLVWTDTMLHALRFIGQPLIYRADVVARACGIIGPRAHAELGGVVYWMGDGNFYALRGGGVEVLRCPVWDDVFRNLNLGQRRKVVAGANSLFHEVWWWFPSGGSLEPDRYVAMNVLDGSWSVGAMSRSAWLDRSVVTKPIGADPATRLLYDHEVGLDADDQPMGEWIESGYFDASEGQQLMFLWRMLPDWRRLAGTVRFTLRFTDYPEEAPSTRGPYLVSAGVRRIQPRVRARQLALRLDGDAAPGGDWRLGALRADARPDGSR